MTPVASPIIWAAGGAILGLLIGSFLGALVLRWPAREQVTRGRSRCDGCGRVLGAGEMVPVLSFLWLRGRCRTCGGRIDPVHAGMESASALIGGAALGLAPGLEGLGWAALGWLLLALAVLDWRHFWLPDRLTWPLAFLGFTLAMWTTDVAMIDRVIGAIGGYLALALIGWTYGRVRGRQGLGLGDAKLLGALGAWFGWAALPFILLSASGLGIVAVLVSMLRGTPVARDARLPLGTLMAVAAVPGWLLMRVLTGYQPGTTWPAGL